MGFIRSYLEQQNEKWARKSLKDARERFEKFYIISDNNAESSSLLQRVLYFQKYDALKKENDDALGDILDRLRHGTKQDIHGEKSVERIIEIINSIEVFKDDRIESALLDSFRFDKNKMVRERAEQALKKRGWKPVSLKDEIYCYLLRDEDFPDKLGSVGLPDIIECLFSILRERKEHQPNIYLRASQFLSNTGDERVAYEIYCCAVHQRQPFLRTVLRKLKWQPVFNTWCSSCIPLQQMGKIQGKGVGFEGGNIRCPSCGEEYLYTISEDEEYLYLLHLTRVSVPVNQVTKTEAVCKPFPFGA